MAVVGVLGMVLIGEMPSLPWLEDGELVGCVWVRVEKGLKVKVGNSRLFRLRTEFEMLATQFDC